MLRQFYREIPAGESVEYIINSFYSPISINLTPGNGGSMKIQYKFTKDSPYKEHPMGIIDVDTEEVLDSPVHALKFFAYTAMCTVALVQA